MKTWGFIKVECGKSDKKAHDDPDALYHYTMLEMDDAWNHSSSLTYRELKPLMFHFQVDKPEDLAGKSFKSPREDAHGALNLLIIQIRHGGEYEPPKQQALYDALATSLAKFQTPDFSNVDVQTVCNAFAEFFEGFKMKPKWFDWLKEEIWARSNGRLLLKRADHKEFKMLVQGPAEYLVLVDQGLPLGDERRLVIGPYSKPVFFDKDK